MEDDKKIQNGRLPKNSKLKTTEKIQNGRRPKKFEMEDDRKN